MSSNQGTYITMGGTGNSQIGAVNFRGTTSTSNVVVYGQIVNQVVNSTNGNISARMDMIAPSNSSGNITYMSCVNGNVGIMNTNPLYDLDITGTFNVYSNAKNALVVTNGNVGINNTNPQYELDVSGTMNITGAIRLGGNTIVTYSSLPSFGSNSIGYVSRTSGTFTNGGSAAWSIIASIDTLDIGVWTIHTTAYFSNSPNAGILLQTYNANTNTDGITGSVVMGGLSGGTYTIPTGYGIIGHSANYGGGAGAQNLLSTSAILQITTAGTSTNHSVDTVAYIQTGSSTCKYILTATRIA